jgi:integrase/recombinase XerD
MLKTVLTPEDIDRLIEAAPTLRDKVIIRLLSRLGCRVSELVNIRIGDVDFRNGLIAIRPIKQVVRKICPRCSARVGKKNNFCPYCGHSLSEVRVEENIRRRVLPVDKETLDMLREYLRLRRTKSDRVIPVSRQTVYFTIRKAAEDAGIPGLIHPETGREHYVSPHRLRDAFATQAISADPSVEGRVKLQHHLGHRSFETTAKYLKFARDREWYDRIWRSASRTEAG